MKKILYISHDGMTDSLGESQVIPYLSGLSKKGYKFHILSCEKISNYLEKRAFIAELLKENNIEWHVVKYTKNPPVLATLMDLFRLRQKAIALIKKGGFSLVHCRSYPASLIGLFLKKNYGVKFIFDMRGLWADERVEGGLWNLKNPVYNLIYRFFKKKEIEFLSKADFTVSLTENAKKEIVTFISSAGHHIPVEVIPCCVDLKLFSNQNINNKDLEELRLKLKINKNDFIISYLGTIGTWYLLEEMLLFFKQILKGEEGAKFLFITNENQDIVFAKAIELKIPIDKIIVFKAPRKIVPLLLKLSKASVFFIKPSYSKKASSPTKLGEILAMGIPVICNSGIGDVDEIIAKSDSGILIHDFSENELNIAVEKLLIHLARENKDPDKSALDLFSLERGINSYEKIYRLIDV